MNLIQILLPLHDNQGRAFGQTVFQRIGDELVHRFGGLTAYSQSPAEGVWQPDASYTSKDRIVVYEVMSAELDRPWWQEYRRRLEAELDQQEIVIRATQIELL